MIWPVDIICIPPGIGGWWTYELVKVPFKEVIRRLLAGEKLCQERKR